MIGRIIELSKNVVKITLRNLTPYPTGRIRQFEQGANDYEQTKELQQTKFQWDRKALQYIYIYIYWGLFVRLGRLPVRKIIMT